MTEVKQPTARELLALAKVQAGKLKRLRFTTGFGMYNAGQVAGFAPEDAAQYLRHKVAVDIDAPPPAAEPKPAEEPPKTETTAVETPPAPAAEAAPAPAAEPKPAEEPRRGKNRGR